jgi:signal transduction histidine kinase
LSDQPRFNISAHVVKQLGEELVTDEVTALVELVKNAYDADATWVNIIIDTQNILDDADLYFGNLGENEAAISEDDRQAIPGYIVIEDNGLGMGRREIEIGWLRIAYSMKRRMVESSMRTPKGRIPLGEKGLGRLSTQRLGRRLEIFTHRDNNVDWSNLLFDEELKNLEQYDLKYERNREHHVGIDWDAFIEGVSLTDVKFYIHTWEAHKPRKGTKMIITGLQNPNVWTDARSKSQVVSQLSQMIFPFEGKPPCRVSLTIDGVREYLTTLIAGMRDSAVSSFAFTYNDNYQLNITGNVRPTRLGTEYSDYVSHDQGRDFFAFLTNPSNKFSLSDIKHSGKGGVLFSFDRTIDVYSLGELSLLNGQFANPGPFRGHIDEFFLRGVDDDDISDVFSAAADYKDAVKRLAGIRVYRDGFGLKPYGLDGYDWLKLGEEQTRGRSFYGMRPGNVVGYVSISAEKNSYLREKTDREGFIDNSYSENFFLIMYLIRDNINNLLFTLRRSFNEYRREQPHQTTGLPRPDSFTDEARKIGQTAVNLESPAKKVSEALDTMQQRVSVRRKEISENPLFSTEEERAVTPLLEEVEEKLNNARSLVAELQVLLARAKQLEPMANSLEARLSTLEDQISDFSELAGLGLTAEALSHEIHNVADRLGERTRAVINNLKGQKDFYGEIIAYTEYVQSAISTLRKQLSHLAPSLRYVREKKDTFQIYDFADDIISFYSERFASHSIKAQIVEPITDFRVTINRGKLTQIMDNILLNSEYWLREAIRRQEIENPLINIEIGSPYVIIYDNGWGIDPSIEGSLFQPFTTMKPKDVGRGLGLFIVRELLDSSGCRIFLLPERNHLNRRYKFQIDLSGIINE